MKYLLLFLILGCKSNQSTTKEFVASEGTAIQLAQIKGDSKYSNFFKFLQNPEAADPLSNDVQVIAYGGGSCPLSMLGQESAPGRGCTYGTTAHVKSGSDWNESPDYKTGWGYSPPNNANPKFSPVYASLAAKLKINNRTSLNLLETAGDFNYDMKLYKSVTQTLGSRQQTVQDVIGINLQSGSDDGAIFTYYIAVSGAVVGVVTSVSAVWNGSKIAAANGDTGEIGYLRNGGSSANTQSQSDQSDRT